MSDKDFVVKNGLVVNTTFTANSTEVHVGNTTVNAVFTSPTTNTLTLTLSNTTVTGTLTSANYTGTSANSTLLNNQNGAYYRNATNINAGTLAWAYQASNTVNTTGNFTMTGNLNLTAANNYFGNDTVTPTVFFNTINSTSNGTTVNSSIISLGNSTVNVTINSTGFSGAANNSTYLNGQLASYYRNATNINAGTLAWAYAPVNTVNTTGNFTMAALTVNPTFIVTNGTVSTTSNSSGLYAPSGNVKTSYLESTGLANLAWANITGNTYVGGNLTVAGYLTVVGTATVVNSVSISTKDHNLILASDSISAAAADGSGITVANTDASTGTLNYTFASLTYRASDDTWNSNQDFAPSADATLNLGTSSKKWNSVYATTLYGTLASSQPGIQVGDSQKLGGVAAASYVQNTDTRVLSGNLNFTGANTFFGSASVQGTAYFGNSTITNTVVNTAAVTLGGTGTTVGNVSLSYSGFIAGNTTVTSNSVVWVSNTAGSTKIGANGAAIGGNAFQVGTTIYVTTTGNTGHGTSSPAAYVEIDNPFGTSSSNTLFLYQNLASGSTSATWSSYRFITTDSADKSYQFRQFNVGPSGVGIGYSPPNATRASSDAMYVAGNTGFNTQTPTATVDINGTLRVAGMSNVGGPISVNGDVSVGWSNGLVNQIFTSTGATTPYWSSNAILNTANATYLNTNTMLAIVPPATYTFSGNATSLTGNVSIYTATAWTTAVSQASGTVSVGSGLATVSGSGTLFTNYVPGTVVTFTNNVNPALNTYYAIKSITNNTLMTLGAILPSPGIGAGSNMYVGGLDLRNRIFVPGIAGLLQTGDKVTYSIGAGNTAIGGITPGTTYSVLWGNATSIALATTGTPDTPINLTTVSSTAQPGHFLTIDYQSSVRVGNNAAGAGIIVIGNSTSNATVNSSSFSGNANNITTFPLNQSVNTSASPTFANITSSTSMRIGGSSQGSTIYFGTTASTTANLSWSTSGTTDTLNFGSSQAAVMTIGTSTVLTSSNYGTFISLTWGAITGKPTGVGYFTNDNAYANSINGLGINGTAATASAVAWSGITGKPTTLAGFTSDTFANSTNGLNINGTAAKSSTLAAGGGAGTAMTFNWSGQGGQPSWLWGGNDGVNMYVYNPGNFSVNYSSTSGTATYATYLSAAQQVNPVFGSTTSMSMTQDSGARNGSFIARATGTGDNLAGMTFWNDSYAIRMGIRNDGVFALGGWSRPGYSWYSDASGNMVAAGNVIAYSDPKLKENITTITNAMDMIQKLDGVNFTWKEGFEHTQYKAGKKDIGVLADQVEAILPEIVSDSVDIGGDKFKMVAYDKLVPVLIEAIKELKAEIEELKKSKEQR